MKHLYRYLPVKIICFILCAVTLCITVLSIAAASLFTSAGLYVYSEEHITEEFFYEHLREDAYDIVEYALSVQSENFEDKKNYNFAVNISNVRYQLHSPDGTIIDSNTDNADNSIWKYSFNIKVYQNALIYPDYGSASEPEKAKTYTVQMYLEENLPASDKYAIFCHFISTAYKLRNIIYPAGIISLLFFIALFAILMCASARRPHSDELYPGTFNKIPFDILLIAASIIAITSSAVLYEFSNAEKSLFLTVSLLSILIILSVIIGLCMSIAARLKQKTFFRNTILGIICRLIKKFFVKLIYIIRSIPLVWKTACISASFFILNFILLISAFNRSGAAIFIWLQLNTLITAAVIYIAISLQNLKKGGEALSKGDLNYKVSTENMLWDFKQHAENLNNIADGMTVVVNERMKSERMKAELITNVSHDIKTPLTSIINYAGLIADEYQNPDSTREYAEVLVRKSEHLKRLLEDLVEFSKSATGNLDIHLEPCKAIVLLTQAAGEFAERCSTAGLELITNYPDNDIEIMADSRRIWRVFENLISNACKYALPGSRVYLSLEIQNNKALFIFKNVSKNMITVSAEELTERFVRGDSSRSTEGSGLGLSIAKNLTELQNGKMDITIDGDLFKVALIFDII